MKKVITSAVLISLLSAGLVLNNRGLEVRNVLNAYTNEAQGRLVTRRANEVAENNLSNVKAQISNVLENGKRHVRFVAALDSYLYESVYFTITANDGTTTKTLVDNEAVNRAYTYIEAGEEVLSASDAFGEGYNYFVAYTINNVPESAWGYTFSASVSAKAEGYSEAVTKSADRVINDMVNDEMIPVEKVDPEVTISIENGATLTIGVDAAPTVTVPEGVNYITYYELDGAKVSDTLPTTPGTYSFIVETEENDQYNSARVWRWFRLVEPITKEDAVVTFNYEPGETFVIGGAEQPTVTVSEGADYVITYSSEESGYNSTEFPTVAGTYSLVVTINENDLYKENKVWRWFRLEAPSEKAVAEITFNFENGATFTKGAEEKPEYTVSEGADVEIYYYSEERDLAGETATFYSYEELIPGYP